MIRITESRKWALVALAAASLTLPTAVFADENGGMQNGYPQDQGSTRIQIQRQHDPLQASASVDRDLGSLNNDEAAKLRSIFAQQAGNQRPQSFRGDVAQDDNNMRGRTPMLDRVLKGQNQQNNLQAMAQNQGANNAPYVWAQSATGGYYDCTNTYKGTVPGYRLRELGGKFADGTPVPQGAVKMNEAGHIWWQRDLSKSFWHY